MHRILIVDDHAVVRSGLRQFLAEAPEARIAGEAGSGREALELAQREDWSLVLLDIGLPDINGLEVLRRLKRSKPGLPVLIFSMFAEEEYATAALEAGAVGFLPKDSAPEEILEAIRRGIRGERYLSPILTERLLAGKLPAPRRLPHEALSEREFSVMLMLAAGTALTDIAERLHLSPKTVSTYRTRIMDKLNLRSNADLTRYVIEHRLSA